jgi:rhodanese-related sulfurtransferase
MNMPAYQDIDALQLDAMLAETPVVLVDVRSDAEVAEGVIDGARHIPLSMLPATLETLAQENAPLVFYCHSGMRSAQACTLASQYRHDKLFNLRGGILAWGKAGLTLSPNH